MRKSFFLTLLLTLCCTLTAWAEFNPTPGVKYALQEKTSGLYLDIQTLGITDQGLNTNNISLSENPCAILFEHISNDWGGDWKIKNTLGQYVFYDNNCPWNPQIGVDATLWEIVNNNNIITIDRFWIDDYLQEHHNYINGTAEAGKPLFCSYPTPMEFTLLEFSEIGQDYDLTINNAPEGKSVEVKYYGNTVEAGQKFTYGSFDINLFTANDIDGYVWNFAINVETNTIILTYTKVEGGDEGDDDDDIEPSLESVVALINRIGGESAASKFKFVLDPSLARNDKETFVLGSEDSKVLIKGSTLSAITTGIGWYLNNVAHINITWNSLNETTGAYVNLPSTLPLPAAETHTSDAKYRHYLNYCTFGYSMSTWTWKRWEKEIDWMALHGVNMPLQIVGLEVVWRNFLMGNGYTEEVAESFIAGPSFTPWWGMNNLEGWGGTTNNAWFTRQENLAKQILARQRALGMEPVLPGFSGMMPSTKEQNGGNWCGFTRPQIISPTAKNFETLAAAYYECLKAVMGESQYYSMDPFHEGAGHLASAAAYTAIYNAMEAAKPGSQWLIQQWQWYGGNQALSLTAVPAGKLIVLDLFSDGQPEFDRYNYNGYAPQDAMFCVVPNFGGRSGLMGRLQSVVDGYFNYKGRYTNLKGICTIPEAIEQTPITYDLVYQLPWMGSKPDVATWVANYTETRYGKDNAIVKEAWDLLRQGPLNYGTDGIQGPVEDVWAARPNLEAKSASTWGKTLSSKLTTDENSKTPGDTYTPARRQMLIDAVYKLLSQSSTITANTIYESNYNFDIVEFGSAVMGDYAHDLLLSIKAAKEAAGTNFANDDTYKHRRNAFLQLILDMDDFKGTNLNFRLGKWTQGARDAAAEIEGYTSETQDWYEFNNARTLITTWGDYNQSNYGGLRDYSYRSWQGLLADYYYPRWKYYFEHDCTHPEGDINNYFFFEWNWAHGMECSVGQTAKSTKRVATSYSTTPSGNTVESANALLAKYLIPVTTTTGTYYAYRHQANDLSGKVTINGNPGGTIDLTTNFGNVTNASVATVTINGASSTTLPTTEGIHTASIRLNDGTSFENVSIKIGQKTGDLYGVYRMTYSYSWENQAYTTDAMIGYEKVDLTDANNNKIGEKEGYMILGTIQYNNLASSEADKLFTITPNGNGYTLSAQGKYLKSGVDWQPDIFSDNKNEASIYNIVQNGEGLYSLSEIAYMKHIFYRLNEASIQLSLTEVTKYYITIPESGYTTIYLPFNVVLPTGVNAYYVPTDISTNTESALVAVAGPGDILLAGTPVILGGQQGEHALGITMSNEGAKTVAPENSALKGSYVKHTLTPSDKIYVLQGKNFSKISHDKTMDANTCWVETTANITDIDIAQATYIKIGDKKFRVKRTGHGITITNCSEQFSGDLVIGSNYKLLDNLDNVLDEQEYEVIGISDNLLQGNTGLTSVTFPATLTSVGTSHANTMFTMSYNGGADGDNGAFENIGVPTANKDQAAADKEAEEFVGTEHKCSTTVLAASTWRMTVDINIADDASFFNDFGSCILATKKNTLAQDYSDGSMQLYLKQNRSLVFKLDKNGERHTYSAPNGTTNDKLTFIFENDGAGGYMGQVIFGNGHEEVFQILASDNAELHDITHIWSSLGTGISVDIKFEKLTTQGLFVGCTNLKAINVNSENESFSSIDGVLYNKNGNHIIRFPQGCGDKNISNNVTKVYAGALHDVNANITFHSNPEILHVEGHGDNMVAKYYLSLEDADKVDFNTAYANTYQTVSYKRATLAEGVYGTIMLPFVPDANSLKKYDFFEFDSFDAETNTLNFKQADEVKANVPYLYKLTDSPEGNLDYITGGITTIQSVNGYTKSVEKDGWKSVGCYSKNTVMTNKGDGTYYAISTKDNQFHRITNSISTRPYRVYYVNTNTSTNAPTILSLRFRNGSTQIINATQVEGWEEDVYYDLMGRRVMNPTNGIYIVNGKKVIL